MTTLANSGGIDPLRQPHIFPGDAHAEEEEVNLRHQFVQTFGGLNKIAVILVWMEASGVSDHNCIKRNSQLPPPKNDSAARGNGAHSRGPRSSLAAELGIPLDAIVIGYAARFHPHKDHRNFIQAAERLHKLMPQVHFLLFGMGVTWENVRLTEWIDSAGIRERCHLLGLRQDISASFREWILPPRPRVAKPFDCGRRGHGLWNALRRDRRGRLGTHRRKHRPASSRRRIRICWPKPGGR